MLLTYDVTVMDSFLHLSNWYDQVKAQSEPDVLIFLVGNKKDMEQEREVSEQKAEQFAKQKNLAGFFETSAKSGENVEETFITAARSLFKTHYQSIREKQAEKFNKGPGGKKRPKPGQQLSQNTKE